MNHLNQLVKKWLNGNWRENRKDRKKLINMGDKILFVPGTGKKFRSSNNNSENTQTKKVLNPVGAQPPPKKAIS